MRFKPGLCTLFFIVLFANITPATCQCTTTLQASERSSQAVELKFYRIQTAEWNSKGHSSKVAVQVSSFANTYCSANPSVCGMESCCSSNTTFKDTNVGIVSGYPEDDRKDMKLKIYLDFPSGANATGTLQCTVGKGALQEIVGNARDQIHTETGSWITYVDDEFYGIPPASDLNRILIPIAFVILFLICLLALILHFWNRRKEELERKRKIIEKRKSNQKMKADPKYNVDTSTPKVPAGVTGKNGTHEKPKRAELHYKATFGTDTESKDELYRERQRQTALAEKKSGSMYSSDSAIKMETEPRHRQAYKLEKKLDSEPVRVEGATNFGYDHENEREAKKDPIKEPLKPPASHLTPLNLDADTEENAPPEKEKKKKKKKKHHHKSKSGEINKVSDIADGSGEE